MAAGGGRCGASEPVWRETSSFPIRTKIRRWPLRCARDSNRRASAAGSPRATCALAGIGGSEIIRGLDNAKVMIVVLSANAKGPFKTGRERFAHPWKSVKIRGGKSDGPRAFRLGRGADPGGDVDVLDADAWRAGRLRGRIRIPARPARVRLRKNPSLMRTGP